MISSVAAEMYSTILTVTPPLFARIWFVSLLSSFSEDSEMSEDMSFMDSWLNKDGDK